MNLYAYVGGDPVNMTDRLGLYISPNLPSIPQPFSCPEGQVVKYRIRYIPDSSGCMKKEIIKKCVPISDLIKPRPRRWKPPEFINPEEKTPYQPGTPTPKWPTTPPYIPTYDSMNINQQWAHEFY